MSNSQASPTPEIESRPTKHRRIHKRLGSSPISERTIDSVNSGSHRLHTRVTVACKACRARKTKCDGVQPVCTFCTARNLTCEYDEIPPQFTGFQALGPQILGAIESLTEFVRLQEQKREAQLEQPCCCHHYRGAPSHVVSTPVDRLAASPAQSSPSDLSVASKGDIRIHNDILVGGLASILQWPIFPPGLQNTPLCDDRVERSTLSHILPSQELSDLLKLESRYIAAVHTKNPMLNLFDLRSKILQVSENGLDWSTNTCLVALVCAIGSLCNPHGFEVWDPTKRDIGKTDREIADMYWGVASKRIGLVVGENSLEAVQCLCLAGIWYISNFQPLKAWKYFTMAGNSWYLAAVVRNPTSTTADNVELKSIEQATFFTSYKSELELRFELGIKGSVLDDFEYPHTFPLPPNLDDPRSLYVYSEQEKTGWYYYLSEIAARHLINRILKSNSQTAVLDPSPSKLKRLMTNLDMYEGQLREWHKSLPPRISFPMPDDTGQPLQDDFKQILRSRFMFIRELCYRPFIEFCLSGTSDLPREMMEKVAQIVSEGLKNCVWRLQFMSSRRAYSQGLWFMIRVAVSSAMILIGAAKANADPKFNVAALVAVPVDWREHVERVLDVLAPFEQDTRGGVKDCIGMVRRAIYSLHPRPQGENEP